MSDWLEHSVQVEIKAPMDLVWQEWSSFEKMPLWMKWIKSVTVPPETPHISRWTLNTGGLEFSWQARMVDVIENKIIRWESVDGLPNRGAIRFYDRHDHSVVRLSVAYNIPTILKFLDSLFLGKAVEATIQEDLERFRTHILTLQKTATD